MATVPLHHSFERSTFTRLRGDHSVAPDISVVVPVNAQGDLQNILRLLGDVAQYAGPYTIEVVLVVNNFEELPPEVRTFSDAGLVTLAIPSLRRKGEAIGFTARVAGIRRATSEFAVSFDADCRVPNVNALINWYVEQFRRGAAAAYTHVEYYELGSSLSIRARVGSHHLARWIKRNILRIPTTRGSNYGVCRSKLLELYDSGYLADELNVGPTMKAKGWRVAYSGRGELTVFTSGRMLTGGWKRLLKYLRYRLRYNLRVLNPHEHMANRTGRENDPVRRYVNNRPV